MTETKEKQKLKIRKRYEGINQERITKIAAAPQENFFEDDSPRRVAVYARVSTDDPRQTSSFELQKNHYQTLINKHPGWNLTQIYADEGISGTSLAHRNAFLQMIEDCKTGNIDLILVKSVARFARNIMDCIGYSRQLAALSPPVGIFFEAETLYTLSPDGEMRLSFLAAMAQEESRSKSEIMNASIDMRFGIGIFLTPKLLGYDHDGNGNLIVNEEEAKTVRLIFFMYLYGHTCQEIADTLTKLHRKTKTGNIVWSPSSILNILQNERHCGDILARKTWTPNFLDHKTRKNRQNKNQYRQNNHHEPIISRDDFLAVQKLIHNARYGYKGFLPELHAQNNGLLKGFVLINPKWAGFKSSDYKKASADISSPRKSTASQSPFLPGAFDLREFEVVKAQFFNNTDRLAVTFTHRKIIFTTSCIRKFSAGHIKLLIHPFAGLIAAVPAHEGEKCAIRWSLPQKNGIFPRQISGTAFLPCLYELFGWNLDFKYRLIGFQKQTEKETILIFDTKDAETLIPMYSIHSDACGAKMPLFGDHLCPYGTKKHLLAFPKDQDKFFGDNYYRQIQTEELAIFEKTGSWDKAFFDKTTSSQFLQPTNPAVVVQNIEELIGEMKRGGIK